MAEIRKNLEENFKGEGNNEAQLFPNQNNINGYNDIKPHQNQAFNNNDNFQFNINEISLPLQSEDETNQKITILPPFSNDENYQNTPNNNIQTNLELNQNINSNNYQNNQNFNNNLNYNQTNNNNYNYNYSEMNYQGNSQEDNNLQAQQKNNLCCNCCECGLREKGAACIGVVLGVISFIISFYLFINHY